jgi:hypothetical protein
VTDKDCIHCVVGDWIKRRGGIKNSDDAEWAIGRLCQSIVDIIDSRQSNRDELVVFTYGMLAHLTGAQMSVHPIEPETVN